MPRKRILCRILTMLMCILLLSGCQSIDTMENETKVAGEDFRIHFIDVGQGDSILIESQGATLLIDAGENDMGERVVSYLREQEITSLDYVIGTHPHSDHIGGLDVVISAMDVSTVIMPAVAHTTKTYEDVLLAIQEKGLKIKKPVVGTSYSLGDASFQIIAPNSSEYDDLNDYSVGIRLTFGKTNYVFAGDATRFSENEMCDSGQDLSADVLKINHHASRYSNDTRFLDAVNPTYAVISLGKDNSYGHPHEEVMEEINKRNIIVHRTDEEGTIVITSDGQNIEFSTEGTKVTQEANVGEIIGQITDEDTIQIEKEVYVTKSGSKYHHEGCSYLKGDTTKMTIDEAKEAGYEPCNRCMGD